MLKSETIFYDEINRHTSVFAVSVVVENNGIFGTMIREIEKSDHVTGNYKIVDNLMFADLVYNINSIIRSVMRLVSACDCYVSFDYDTFEFEITQDLSNMSSGYSDYYDNDNREVYVFNYVYANDVVARVNNMFKIPFFKAEFVNFGDNSQTSALTFKLVV